MIFNGFTVNLSHRQSSDVIFNILLSELKHSRIAFTPSRVLVLQVFLQIVDICYNFFLEAYGEDESRSLSPFEAFDSVVKKKVVFPLLSLMKDAENTKMTSEFEPIFNSLREQFPLKESERWFYNFETLSKINESIPL